MSTAAETQSQRGNNFTKHDQTFMHRNHANSHPLTRSVHHPVYTMQSNQAAANLLAHGLQGMTVQDAQYSTHAKNALMAANAAHYAGVPLGTAYPTTLWGSGSPYMYSGNHGYAANTHQQSPGLYSPMTAQYLTHGYSQHQSNSPMSQNWTPSHTTGDIPTLVTPRRDSVSSNENDAPGTPSISNYPYPTGVAIAGRSLSGLYAHSTPSPSQLVSQHGMMMKQMPEVRAVSPSLHMLVTKEPAIPPAIPAPSSPLKPLDRALENLRGETNVYIRGLHPDTTDDKLESWGRRFGDIKSSKSIIDHSTGLCKGFGFIKYHNYEDAENCIRGFHYLGYEVSFARESFYSKLKTFADDANTNLYVSNLPKTMNEHELASIFTPFNVCSARILRDKNGMGRGVGFARFDSRNVCEEVIKQFNNNPIQAAGEEHVIQIRYADTQDQKQLKQQTAAARQFRSAEYEFATQAHKQAYTGNGRLPPYAPLGHENVNPNNDFEAYLGTSPGVPFTGQRWAQSALRGQGTRAPLAVVHYDSNIQHPSVMQSSYAKQLNGQTPVKVNSASDTKTTGTPAGSTRNDSGITACPSSDDQIR